MLGAGAWALLFYLPAHAPLSSTIDSSTRLSDELYYAGTVTAAFMILSGIILAVSGALYRAQAEVLCRNCHRQVIGWKSTFGLQCPLDKHYARINWFMLILTIAFWTAVLAAVGAMAFLLYA
ncbi:MAG: hypothetical protein AAGC55_30580 [Myxococcota bacterium]